MKNIHQQISRLLNPPPRVKDIAPLSPATTVQINDDADHILLLGGDITPDQAKRINDVMSQAYPSQRTIVMVVPDVTQVRFVRVSKQSGRKAPQKASTKSTKAKSESIPVLPPAQELVEVTKTR